MKTALITGANRGIGFETARQLGKLEYRVILGARTAAAAEEAAKKLSAEGLKTEFVAIDIDSEDSVAAALATVTKLTNGVLDVLVNNAGILVPSGLPEGTEKVNLDVTRRCFETNVIGTARVVNHFLDLVKAAPEGRIVNLSSIMGSLELKVSGLHTFAYNASKAALNMYTVDLAMSLQNTHVKVNSAHPGWVKTEMGGEGASVSIEEGAETSVYLATLPADGPTGGYFFKKDRLPW